MNGDKERKEDTCTQPAPKRSGRGLTTVSIRAEDLVQLDLLKGSPFEPKWSVVARLIAEHQSRERVTRGPPKEAQEVAA